jgi:prepilin-type N-terminal cleavage/methylation domain-containing protein
MAVKADIYRQFTLIELLVVITIIAILAAMLLPALSRSRDQARGTYCISNLRNLAFGIAFYTEENDNMLPGEYGVSRDGRMNTPTSTGLIAVSGAFDEPDVWLCPSDKRPADTYTFSFSMFGRLGWRKDETPRGWFIKSQSILEFDPQRAMLLGEEATERGAPPFHSPLNDARFTNTDVFGPRHLDFSQAVFLEGHVEKKPVGANPWFDYTYWPYYE